ncbi:RidA family protein [Bradyrhizobium sediminis]|uniref:RidA family protein n=1 Tax=Bradyrhizobium sediminis TaxID=2840469 RepID=A0A975RQC3_9BRAD|nr:Rid family hydrolase [Bradyrhizobium sediminis]QWG16365.1 RidA family protein [Bradyrhizobium sediminis]
MSREPLTLGKPFEKKVLFSLGVVSSGRMLHTAGITARDANGDLVGAGDMRAQVEQCFSNLGDVLEAANASFGDVVKYTIYTTDIALFDSTTRDIRFPFFVDRPASTLIEVSRLIDPGMLVEIEAIACLGES